MANLRVAMVSVHTSPLAQPGIGDAGGMNVYLAHVSEELAALGVNVDIFTRTESADDPPVVDMFPGVRVHHIPDRRCSSDKDDLPEQLCGFIFDVLRASEPYERGYYDIVHSHYWLGGLVGRVARQRWGVPLVHTAHTLALTKNAHLPPGFAPESPVRVAGEEQIVQDADALIANTIDEASELQKMYDASPSTVHVIPPGVDLGCFTPGDQALARTNFGLDSDSFVLLYVGRLQTWKGPDVLLRAAAELAEQNPDLRARLNVVICGGTSGSGAGGRPELEALARSLAIDDIVRFIDPLPAPELAVLYRAADVTVVPSRSESFGLVAVESQASGTPVVAADVGGLRTSVESGVSGVLIDGHDPASYASVFAKLSAQPEYRALLAEGAVKHAAQFSWKETASGLLQIYREIRHLAH